MFISSRVPGPSLKKGVLYLPEATGHRKEEERRVNREETEHAKRHSHLKQWVRIEVVPAMPITSYFLLHLKFFNKERENEFL